jgi:hypothetical protein
MRQGVSPLRLIDPGWLFVIAGMAMCAAVLLIPAHRNLDALHRQLDELHAQEAELTSRLSAHAAFLEELDRGRPSLVRRLAAEQLNLIPAGDEPLTLVRTPDATIWRWIDGRVASNRITATDPPQSVLSRIANGPARLWVLGGSVFCVFMGLMMTPGGRNRAVAKIRKTTRRETGAEAVETLKMPRMAPIVIEVEDTSVDDGAIEELAEPEDADPEDGSADDEASSADDDWSVGEPEDEGDLLAEDRISEEAIGFDETAGFVDDDEACAETGLEAVACDDDCVSGSVVADEPFVDLLFADLDEPADEASERLEQDDPAEAVTQPADAPEELEEIKIEPPTEEDVSKEDTAPYAEETHPPPVTGIGADDAGDEAVAIESAHEVVVDRAALASEEVVDDPAPAALDAPDHDAEPSAAQVEPAGLMIAEDEPSHAEMAEEPEAEVDEHDEATGEDDVDDAENEGDAEEMEEDLISAGSIEPGEEVVEIVEADDDGEEEDDDAEYEYEYVYEEVDETPEEGADDDGEYEYEYVYEYVEEDDVKGTADAAPGS